MIIKIYRFVEIHMSIKERAKQLKTDIPAVFLCLKAKETPVIAKILAGITVAYALSPIDLVPDFIPVLGYLDDLLILPLMVTLTIKLIPQGLWQEFLGNAMDMWQGGKPKKWYFAIPIILFWIFIIFLLISWLLRALPISGYGFR